MKIQKASSFIPLFLIASFVAFGCSEHRSGKMSAPAKGSLTEDVKDAPGTKAVENITKGPGDEATTETPEQGGQPGGTTPSPGGEQSNDMHPTPGSPDGEQMPDATPAMEPKVSAAPAGTTANAMASLKLSVPAGTVAKYGVTSDMSVDGIPGSPSTKFGYTFQQNYTFGKSSGSGLSVELAFDKAAPKKSDSKMPGIDATINQMVKGIQGVKLQIDAAPTGAVSTMKAISGTTQGNMAQFGGLQGMTFPSKPIKPGDTWTVKVDYSKYLNGLMSQMGMGGNDQKETPATAKFLRFEGDGDAKVAVISLKMHVNRADAGDGKMPGGIMKLKMDITVDTDAKYNVKTGLLQSSVTNSLAKMGMDSGGKAPAGSPSSISLNIRNKVVTSKL